MPEDVQVDLVRSIPGLEKAEIVRPAYGVEYDHIDARELRGAFCVSVFIPHYFTFTLYYTAPHHITSHYTAPCSLPGFVRDRR